MSISSIIFTFVEFKYNSIMIEFNQSIMRGSRSWWLFLLVFCCASNGFTQDKNKDYLVACVAFYNVENLFDTLDTEGVRDSEYTPTGANAWTSQRYNEKLDRLSEVIVQLGTDYTPDGAAVLGLVEIENRSVIEDLVATERLKSRNYQIVHYDSPDKRGIDVGLVYNPDYLTVESSAKYPLNIEGMDNFYTRDQLLVSGNFQGERMHFIVAHWPSRRGGEKRSSPLRQAAADVTRHIIDSIQVAEGPQAKVIFMGDLNDDPTSKSLVTNLNAAGNKDKLKENQLFNASMEHFKKGIGTLAWRDTWNLFDQMVLTQSLLDTTFKTFSFYKFVVFNKPFLMQPSGRFKGYPFRSFAGGQYLGGYSDHFPVYVILLKEK